MCGRIKLPTTIDRRREAWMAFPGLSPNHCYVMCSFNNYAVLVSQLLVEDSPLSCAVAVQEPPKLIHFGVYFGLVKLADESFQLVVFFF